MILLKEFELFNLNGTNDVDGIWFRESKTDFDRRFSTENIDNFELPSLEGTNNVNHSLSSQSQIVTSSSVSGFDSFIKINIPSFGSASPYPSTINVSGLTTTITKITVTLYEIHHTFPDDIDILLVGPTGLKTILMSDVGGNNDLNGVTLTFDSTATTVLPDSGQITTGIYKPTNIGTTDLFATPAPNGPYSTSLDIFNNTNPNGTWRLFVTDDESGDFGYIDDGWRLNISTQNPIPLITLAVSPTSVTEDGTANLIYTFTRTGCLCSPLTVKFTRSGTAIDDSDYTDSGNVGNTVTFAVNSATARVTVDPKADTTVEPNETVIFTLASGTDYTIGTTTPVIGTILNDDPTRITLAVSPTSVTEDGAANLVYTFTRTGSLTNSLTVNYGITGTATRGTDYVNIGTNVTFAVNSATARVTVDPRVDTTVESNETVILTLASGTGYTIGTTTPVTGTIINDDRTSIQIATNSNDSLTLTNRSDRITNFTPDDDLKVVSAGLSGGLTKNELLPSEQLITASHYNSPTAALNFDSDRTSLTPAIQLATTGLALSGENTFFS